MESKLFLRYLNLWELAGWVCINILIPVALPLFVLWLFSIPKITAALSSDIIIKSIGKGELLWAAMSMAAAACYELFAIQRMISNPDWIGATWIAIFLHLAIILSSTILVGLGSMSQTHHDLLNPNIPDTKIFGASIGILLVTVISYTCIHAILRTIDARNQTADMMSNRRQSDG